MQNIVEKYLRFPQRFRIPWYVSAQIMVGGPYLLWRLISYIWVESDILPLESVFILRDVLSILFLSPLYLYFLDRIREAPEGLETHLDKDWLVNKLFNRFFSNKGFLVCGFTASLFYLSVTTWYLQTGFYNFQFYIERLSSSYGVFFLGGIAYQAIILLVVLGKGSVRACSRILA